MAIENAGKTRAHLILDIEELPGLVECVFQSTGIAVITADINCVVTGVNTKAESIFGWLSSEVIGKPLMDLYKLHDVASHNLERAIETVQRTGEFSFTYSTYMDSGSGTRACCIESCLEGIYNSRSNLIGFSNFLREAKKCNQTDDDMLESELRYRTLFDGMSNGVAVYKAVDGGDDFVFADYNSAGQEMDCVVKEDVLGRRITKVFPGVVEFGLLNVLSRVWRTGVAEEHPLALYEDGKMLRWRKNSVYKLPSGEVVAVYSDETLRRQSEEALRKSEEQYRLLVETMVHGVLEIDINGQILFVNPAILKMAGLESSDIVIGRSIYEFQDKNEAKKMQAIIKDLVKHQPDPEPLLTTLIDQDGDVLDIQSDWDYRWNETGEVSGFISILTDITQRRKSEQALAAEHTRFKTVMDSLDAMVYVADMHTYEVLYANKTVRKQRGDVTGGICWKELQRDQTEPCPFCTNSRLLNENGKPNEPFVWEFQNTINGKWYQCRDQAIQWTDRRMVRLGLLMDITDRKNAEIELRESEKKLRITLREKEILLREIHHRVKNNMQVVTSLLNLQARKITDVHALDAIQKSQRRIGVISQVHEALYLSGDLSRISMDKYLTGVLREITSLYLAAEDSIGYLVDADDLVLSISDAIPVGLVTNELVTNAFKHAFPGDRKGLIRITIREHTDGIVELLVADDGVGMPEGLDIDVVDSLGLQIVYNLVKIQLGGSIEMINHKGTTFSIKFNQTTDKEPDSILQGSTGSK